MAFSPELNERFSEALAVMEDTSKNLFITGKAGTGKSTLLSYFCAMTDKKPVVLAPTGVAALNVKGQTIHSFFNFYVDVTPQSIRARKTKPREPKLYKKLKAIIIDEVSMLRADMLDCIDEFLRLYGPHEELAFGGVQMIFIGDLYQLPPVVSRDEQPIFDGHYATPYFFSAHALQEEPPEIIELTKVYRQKDQRFVDLLNRIRSNSIKDTDIKHLNSRHGIAESDSKEGRFITLTTTNLKADEINNAHLEALKGRIHKNKAVTEGEFGKEYFPTAPELTYKIGAQIMMLNNDSDRRWVNGSIGTIESVEHDADGDEYLMVRLADTRKRVEVRRHAWEVYRTALEQGALVSVPVGTFTQYPFRLAWAITIHKSQGKTFDHVVIDIGTGTFAAGQIYVALSRCTAFEGIILKTPIRSHNIRTDERIADFFNGRTRMLDNGVAEKVALIRKVINEKGRIEITYLKANDTQTTRIVIPSTVGEARYQGQIYQGMRAHCTKRDEPRLFRVDRILAMKQV
ncbi:MAG: WYL domain-containing protein [Alphaproteobacteria bacterium]|nr:WYL domain-containing protein [Alphaproteobacteria bacterium]